MKLTLKYAISVMFKRNSLFQGKVIKPHHTPVLLHRTASKNPNLNFFRDLTLGRHMQIGYSNESPIFLFRAPRGFKHKRVAYPVDPEMHENAFCTGFVRLGGPITELVGHDTAQLWSTIFGKSEKEEKEENENEEKEKEEKEEKESPNSLPYLQTQCLP